MLSYGINQRQQQWLRRCGLLALFTIALWTNATSAQIPAQVAASCVAPFAPAAAYTPGVLIVKLKPDVQLVMNHDKAIVNTAVTTDHQALNQTLLALGVAQIEALFTAETTSRPRAAGDNKPLAHIYRLHLATTTEISAAIESLHASDAVEYAEPDYIARAALIPNDPQWNEQWALNALHAPAAWDVTQGADTAIFEYLFTVVVSVTKLQQTIVSQKEIRAFEGFLFLAHLGANIWTKNK